MDLTEIQSQSNITNRFLWIDNHTFKIINNDGVERIIDYTNGEFKEIASNVSPFFKKSDGDNGRFYLER